MGFSADWLALREPADHAARDSALVAAAAHAAGPHPVMVDLGCGTGSTIRAFDGHLTGPARWRLVDNDPLLLAHAARAVAGDVTTHRIDLRDLDALPLDDATLVTASALLDLCSQSWVESLAERLARQRLPFYAALNYDGVMRWTPADPNDAVITQAFNRHQRQDKGFGPALGPDAANVIADVFAAVGYRILQAESPWHLTVEHAALNDELVQGIAQAASEAGASDAASWGVIRRGRVGTTVCHVGHRDILALPAGAV